MLRVELGVLLLIACAPIVEPAHGSQSLPLAPTSTHTTSEAIPTAEVAPAPATPPPPVDPGLANRNPDDDQVVGPPDVIPDCEDRLRALGVKFRAGSIPVRPQPAGYSCGAPQIVVYEAGPTGVKWNAAPVVTCQLALGLARFETLLSEQTQSMLGKRVVRINQGGTYSCRKMARFKLVSEHSYANAIDIRSFELDDKTSISVKRHFGKLDAEPATPESKFLRTVANRTFDDALFSVVLTPYWDALHSDHFHFDDAHFRVDGTRR